MSNFIFDYFPVIIPCLSAILLFFGSQYKWENKIFAAVIVLLLIAGAAVTFINNQKNDQKSAKLLALIKTSEMKINVLLQQVTQGNSNFSISMG